MRYRVDPAFKFKILDREGGASFKTCFQCGTCTAKCPVSQHVDLLRPNKIVHLAKLGVRNHIHSNGFWLCAGCNACVATCPQGVDLPAIMHAMKSVAAAEDEVPRFLCDYEALREIPLPLIYTWLCLDPDSFPQYHYRTNEWVHRSLQGYLRRYQAAKPAITHTERVAVIGSGPAGLACAWELIRRGVAVTIFEREAWAGGMLRTGLPAHRLPKELVDAEIQHLEAMGVIMKTHVEVDAASFRALSGYDAVFLATGSHRTRSLRVEGEDLDGVIHAIDFLKTMNTHGLTSLDRVVVIGGGGVAIDAARTAIRCGGDVRMFCLESRREIPGHEWELQQALSEGVELEPSWGVQRILGETAVTGLVLKRCVQVFDAHGRFHPQYDEATTKQVDAETLILAIGQGPDVSYVDKRVQVGRGILIDPHTQMTSADRIYAGGDAVRGVASIMEAMDDGKHAAEAILTRLSRSWPAPREASLTAPKGEKAVYPTLTA